MKKMIRILIFLLFLSLSLFVKADVLVDPTRPPDFAAPTLFNFSGSQLVLSAIYISPYARRAIINNRLVKLGDQLNGFTITNISTYTVELTGPQHEKQVLLLTKQVKQAR